jgi:hypothetical protein
MPSDETSGKGTLSVTLEAPNSSSDSGWRHSIPGYRLERKLSEGGQGVVYQAIQESTRRKVAIKMMRGGAFIGSSDKARFDREVHVLGRLSHANIVTIHDSGTTRDGRYIVMDYIAGRPLDHYIRSQDTPISIEDILRLFQKICTAINAAHLAGIIHRDLKPSNILIDAAGEPHILDFGLAKVPLSDSEASAMTMTGHFVGSLPWASPEQAEGSPDKIDMRTDVYSLGVILYQLLTGKFPYEVAGNARDVLDRIIHAEPAKPGTYRREVNDEIGTIVLKCLSKDRERRYQSAGELARDLQNYLEGFPILAKRDSFGYLLRKQLKRYRVPVAVGAGFVILILAALIISLSLWRRAALGGATARFRLEAARNETNKEVEEYQDLVRSLRRTEELIVLSPWIVNRQFATEQSVGAQRDSAEWIEKLFPVSPDGKAPSSGGAISSDVMEAMRACVSEPGHQDSRVAFAWLRANQNRVESLEEALRQNKLRFVSVVYKGRLIGQTVPSLSIHRLGARLLVANALFHHCESEAEAAVDNLLAASLLSRYVGDNPYLISTLVEISFRNSVYSALRWMVADAGQRGKIPVPYLQFLERELPFPEYDLAYVTELRVMRQVLNESFVKASDKARARLDLSSLRNLVADVNEPEDANPYKNPTESMKAEAKAIEYEHALALIQEYYDVLRTHRDATFQELKVKSEQIEQSIKSHPALTWLIPDFINALRIRLTAKMNRDATVIATAIYAFRDGYGRWPKSLDEALGPFPKKPYCRTYYGHDFIYRIVNDGPLLYTVGPNGIDDSAQGRRFELGLVKDVVGDDVLFLVPDAPGSCNPR